MAQVKEMKVAPQMNNRAANEALCAALMADEGTFGAVRDLVKPTDIDVSLDPRCFYIMEAAWAAALGKPPKPTNRANIAEQLFVNGKLDYVGLDYLRELDDAGFPNVVRAAKTNAEIIRNHASRRETLQLLRATINEIETNPGAFAETVNETKDKLANISIIRTEYDPSFANWEDSGMDTEPASGKPSRLAWFNQKAFGFQEAKIHAVIAPPKNRKTTLIRNVLLDAIIDGTPISWFTVDGTQDHALRALIVMLATRIMQDEGVPEFTQAKDGREIHQWNLSDRGLPTHLRTPEQDHAIRKAFELRKKSRLMMYDSTQGFKSLSRLKSIIHRDYTMVHSQKNDNQASILVVDFVQRLRHDGKKMGWQDSDFERSVADLTDIAQYYKMTSFIVSQPTQSSRNEQDKNAKLEDVVINDKGGGALLEACDFQWNVGYNKVNPNKFSVRLIESRGSGIGEMEYNINPSSGLIINPGAGTYQAVEGY